MLDYCDRPMIALSMAYRSHGASLTANNSADVSRKAKKPLLMVRAQKLNRKSCFPDDQTHPDAVI